MGVAKQEENDVSERTSAYDISEVLCSSNRQEGTINLRGMTKFWTAIESEPVITTEGLALLKQKEDLWRNAVVQNVIMQPLVMQIKTLENTVASHESLIKDLKSSIEQIRDGSPALGSALKRIACDIGHLEFVVSMHHTLKGDTLHMVVIHDSEDKIAAMHEFYGRFRSIEVAFPDLYFHNTLLHQDDVMPSHLSDTMPFFTRK